MYGEVGKGGREDRGGEEEKEERLWGKRGERGKKNGAKEDENKNNGL